MKRILITVLAIAAIMFGIQKMDVMAADLDRIERYVIKVDVRDDATLDLVYYIEWTVLDSKSEGPLEWVKIGIPNHKVDEIKALTDNIDDAYYTSDSGDYIRVNFKKKYTAGETVVFSFSTHQSNVYNMYPNQNKATYEFTAGWFDEIKVNEAKLLWSADKVSYADASTENDGYYIWQEKLGHGEKLNAVIEYPLGAYVFDEEETAQNVGMAPADLFVIFFIHGLVVFIFIVTSISSFRRRYQRGRGFGAAGYVGRSSHHSGGGGCACACACACAGGGRAGCSVKWGIKSRLQEEKSEVKFK